MKNREMITTLNALYEARKREENRKEDEKVFTGVLLFTMSRNLRTLEKEYNENYLKDLQELRAKYYETEEREVIVPADAERGIEEHTEKQKVDVLKSGQTEAEYVKELNTLLDLEADVPIRKVTIDDVSAIYDFHDMDAIDFMVE